MQSLYPSFHNYTNMFLFFMQYRPMLNVIDCTRPGSWCSYRINQMQPYTVHPVRMFRINYCLFGLLLLLCKDFSVHLLLISRGLAIFRCSVVIVAHSIATASWNIDYVIVPVVIAELSWEYIFLSVSLNRSTWRNWTESKTLMASVASIVRVTGDRRQANQSLMYFVSLKQSSCQKITLTCPCFSSMYFWWKLIMK